MRTRISLAILLALAIELPVASAADRPSPLPAKLVPLSSVRLLDGTFADAVKVNRAYLLVLDPNRLLAPFLREAGLPQVLGDVPVPGAAAAAPAAVGEEHKTFRVFR